MKPNICIPHNLHARLGLQLSQKSQCKIPGSVVFWLPTTSFSELSHPLYQDRSDWCELGGPAGPDHPIIFRDTMILSGDHLSRVFDCIQSCIIMREM